MPEAPLAVEVIEASPLWQGRSGALHQALAAAGAAEGVGGALALLLADDAALADLNARFRGRQGPTNVLSFPPAAGAEPGFLGDIALAGETVADEAHAQGKSFEHHAAHLAVHGFLHLLGYDHAEPAAAEAMEARERAILASLGIADPYA